MDQDAGTIAIIAIIISLAAMLFTGFQAFLTRQHNRLSVKPCLTTWRNGDDQDDNYVVQFDLLNNGLGTAIIKSMTVFFDGKEIGSGKDHEALEAAILKQAEPYKIIEVSIDYLSTFGAKFPFPAGGNRIILKASIPKAKWGANEANFKKSRVDQFMDKFDVKIDYCSMYDEEDTYDSRKDRPSIPVVESS